MSEEVLKWTLKMVIEIQKHAEKDGCYSCKQLLKAPFLKPLLEMPAMERVKRYLEAQKGE